MNIPICPDLNQKLRRMRQIQIITQFWKRGGKRLVALFFIAFVLGVLPVVLYGQGMRNSSGFRRNEGVAEDLSRASVSRTSAEQIVGKIPWQYFSSENQARIKGIISNHTLYRRLPISGGYCNPEILDFILSYPETIVGLWETLGYTDLTLQRVGQSNYLLQDTAGTAGNIDVLFHSDEMLVVWCNGSYRGPVKTGEIVGEMLIVLQVRYTQDVQRKPVAICRLDSFVRVKNIGIDLMGRIFGPALGKIADNNLEQTFVFVNSISKTAEESPDTLRDLVLRTTSLNPQTRENFLLMARRAYEQKQALVRGEEIRYQLLPKLGQSHGNYARMINRNTPEVSPTGVRAWQAENVPPHWRSGQGIAPANGQATSLTQNQAAFAQSIRPMASPVVSRQEYASASEERSFAANVQADNSPSTKPAAAPVRVEAARPVAKIPNPTLLSPEESSESARAETASPSYSSGLLLLPSVTPGISSRTVKETKSGTRTEVVPENTWRSVPSAR